MVNLEYSVDPSLTSEMVYIRYMDDFFVISKTEKIIELGWQVEKVIQNNTFYYSSKILIILQFTGKRILRSNTLFNFIIVVNDNKKG